MLQGSKIIIGITGSIAAYKIPFLIRMLIKEGAEVQVLMTPAAKDFVTPLTLATLSKRPVIQDGFDPSTGYWYSHIDLGRWADLMLMAPLSANTMGKMAGGMADNLLLAVYLAARCPVYFAPAMDEDMFMHPATQKNISILQSYGNILIPPAEGELASGLTGSGRMREPSEILSILGEALKKKSVLKGKKVLITAGPTYEAIDPVRFIGNRSSGKMGYALAEAFAGCGADVILVSGPVSLAKPQHQNIRTLSVESAAEMYQACMKEFPDADITVMSAAVADFRPVETAAEKIKKHTAPTSIQLRSTTDILAELGKIKNSSQFLAGFALETENAEQNAIAKLHTKNADLIVLNSLKDEGAGFGYDTNKVSLLDKSGKLVHLPLMSKQQAASEIVEHICKMTS